MLDPPEDDDVEFIELDEPAGDYGQDAEEGDFRSDEREILLEKGYDR